MTAVMEAVVEPRLWPDAADLLAEFFGGVAAMAEFHDLAGHRIVLGPRSRFLSDKTLALYLDHYAALCPRPQAMQRPDLPGVQTDRMLDDDRVQDANPFFTEFLAADGMRDYLGLRLALRSDGADVLAIHRLKGAGHATDDEIAWMEELAPFLRSAFRARALLGETSLGADGLIGKLARLEAPLVFLDARGEVLFQNGAASLLSTAEPHLDWAACLRSWLLQTAASEDSSTAIVTSPGGQLHFRIFDLRGANADHSMGSGVYVVLLRRRPASSDDRLAGYGLTAAERGVLEALMAGRTPAETARVLDVSLTTVRTHIARLHEKFGVGRTIDVIRLALQAARGAGP
jgi:DNA-binding CsgD family transcriptional regulator